MKVDNSFLPEMMQTIYIAFELCQFFLKLFQFLLIIRIWIFSAYIQKALSLATREVCGISNLTLPLLGLKESATRKKPTFTLANVLHLFTVPRGRRWPKETRKQANSEWCGERLPDLMETVVLCELDSGTIFHQKPWVLLSEWYVILWQIFY